MKVPFYFLIGETKRIIINVEAESEDEAIKEVIREAENETFAFFLYGTFIALKSDIRGYGLA